MALSAKLHLKQSQSLTMTPQLLQSIKLLQFSTLELHEFVAAEMEKNPLLETATEQSDRREEKLPEAERVESGQNEEIHAVVSSELAVNTEISDGIDKAAMENVFDSGTSGADANTNASSATPNSQSSTSSGSGQSENAYNLEAFVADTISLQQHLLEQTNVTLRNSADRGIAEEIIGSMDNDGYLRRDLAEIAIAQHTDIEDVEAVLSVIHKLDPAGICARDLRECLTIQLKLANRFDPMMEKMLENLQLLAKRDFSKLREVCGATQIDLQDMVQEIRALDPRPASRFDTSPVQEVVPDVFVRASADGGWTIELNTDALPKVLVNQTYFAEVSSVVSKGEDKGFVLDCLNSANWLIKSLEQRAETILKVSTEIVKQQDMFFAYGVEHLKPLTLKAVANNIKMHESTVSRVTSNKYIVCDRGVFEMKYFFTSAIASSTGQASHSAEAVRHKINALVDLETPDQILSDDALVELLNAEGIDIARRTVAKYRESMGIPSSVQRRREKRNLNAAA